MAVTRTELHEHTDIVPVAAAQGLRVAWGGVWSGFLVATGIFLLLSILGLAVGVTTASVAPGEGPDAGQLGLGAVIWSGVSLLIALFVGGFVATRTGQVYDRMAGTVEGVLVWVLSILAIVYMASSGVGMLASSASGVLGGITEGARAAASNIDVGSLASGDPSQIVARLNDPKTAQLVAAATGMPQDQARSTLGGIAQQVEAARANPTQAAAAARSGLQQLSARATQRLEQAAATAKPYASAAMWGTLIVMVIALIAAILGAMLGRRQVENRLGLS